MDTIPIQLNFEFNPNIDKTRNLYQKCENILNNNKFFTAASLRLISQFKSKLYYF